MALSAKKAAQKNKKKNPGKSFLFFWRKGRNEEGHLADKKGID